MTEVEQIRKKQLRQIEAAYDELRNGGEMSCHKMAELFDDPNFGPELEYILRRAFFQLPYTLDDGFAWWQRNGGLTPTKSHFKEQITRATAETLNLFPFAASVVAGRYDSARSFMRQIWLIEEGARVQPLALETARYYKKQLTKLGQTLQSMVPEIGWRHPAIRSIVVVVTACHPTFDCVKLTIIKPPEKPEDLQ